MCIHVVGTFLAEHARTVRTCALYTLTVHVEPRAIELTLIVRVSIQIRLKPFTILPFVPPFTGLELL